MAAVTLSALVSSDRMVSHFPAANLSMREEPMVIVTIEWNNLPVKDDVKTNKIRPCFRPDLHIKSDEV